MDDSAPWKTEETIVGWPRLLVAVSFSSFSSNTHIYSLLQSKRPLPRSLRALSQWTQGKEMEMIENRQNKAD